MSVLLSVYAAFLFFVLVPGIVASLPAKGSKYIVAATHAIVFALIYHFTCSFVARFEGFATSTSTSTTDGPFPAIPSLDEQNKCKSQPYKHMVGVAENSHNGITMPGFHMCVCNGRMRTGRHGIDDTCMCEDGSTPTPNGYCNRFSYCPDGTKITETMRKLSDPCVGHGTYDPSLNYTLNGVQRPDVFKYYWTHMTPKTIKFGCKGPSCVPWGTNGLSPKLWSWDRPIPQGAYPIPTTPGSPQPLSYN
jgi:hypothetical protein